MHTIYLHLSCDIQNEVNVTVHILSIFYALRIDFFFCLLITTVQIIAVCLSIHPEYRSRCYSHRQHLFLKHLVYHVTFIGDKGHDIEQFINAFWGGGGVGVLQAPL